MARMKDFPYVIRKIGFITFCKRVWQQIGDDNCFTWASALAYSWLFALFPFLVFLLSLIPLIPMQNKDRLQKQIDFAINRAMPSEAGEIIKSKITAVMTAPPTGGFLSFGLLLTAWAASGGMAMTMSALDKAYDIEKSRSFLKHRLVALMLTGIVAVMVIAVLILLPISSAALNWAANNAAWLQEKLHLQYPFIWIALFNVVRLAFALILLLSITAIIYHFGPNLKHKFQTVSPGAIFSIVSWLTTGSAFRIYINSFGGGASYQKTYGTVAGLVILLLFFYVDSLILLIGAEINSEIDFAVLGVASGTSPEEKATAPIDTPQNRALAAEISEQKDATKDRVGCDDPNLNKSELLRKKD